MSILVSRPAPEFRTTAVMPDKSFDELSLSDYRGDYLILFFYPLDFSFVCPTEIIAFSEAFDQFDALGAAVLGCSVDSPYAHLAWMETPRTQGGLGSIRFPLLSDLDKTISASYGVLLPHRGTALRGLFLIDRAGIVQHELVNNAPLGRNVAEALRTLRELQFVEQHGEVCPANWDPGDAGIKGTPNESRAFFEKAYAEKK